LREDPSLRAGAQLREHGLLYAGELHGRHRPIRRRPGITSNAVAIVQLVNACATKTVIGTHDYTNREGPTCMSGCL